MAAKNPTGFGDVCVGAASGIAALNESLFISLLETDGADWMERTDGRDSRATIERTLVDCSPLRRRRTNSTIASHRIARIASLTPQHACLAHTVVTLETATADSSFATAVRPAFARPVTNHRLTHADVFRLQLAIDRHPSRWPIPPRETVARCARGKRNLAKNRRRAVRSADAYSSAMIGMDAFFGRLALEWCAFH